MKKLNKYKILTVILLAIVIICSSRLTLATQVNPGGNIQTITTTNGSASNNTMNTTNNVANQPVNNVPVQTPTPTPTNTNLPETGAESSIGLIVLIVVASISAIYTYSKVKEYNI